jgi:hypothetical protein
LLQPVNSRSQGRHLRPKRFQFILWIGHAGKLSHLPSQRKGFVAGVLVSLRNVAFMLYTTRIAERKYKLKDLSPAKATNLNSTSIL